jgi:hypothetical protein
MTGAIRRQSDFRNFKILKLKLRLSSLLLNPFILKSDCLLIAPVIYTIYDVTHSQHSIFGTRHIVNKKICKKFKSIWIHHNQRNKTFILRIVTIIVCLYVGKSSGVTTWYHWRHVVGCFLSLLSVWSFFFRFDPDPCVICDFTDCFLHGHMATPARGKFKRSPSPYTS